MKILLHCCCAPCAGGCAELLLEQGHETVLYFANSNLASVGEYELRLESVKRLAELFRLELTAEPYDHAMYLKRVEKLEAEPEGGARCAKCFGYSLELSAAAAKRLRCDKFCTSLTVSPHKNSKLIGQIGGTFHGFIFYDFKKNNGFARSREIAEANNFYLQNFCGCEFSTRKICQTT